MGGLHGGGAGLPRLAQFKHLRAIAQLVKVIGPCLHHLDPLRHVFGAVVGHAQRAAFAVGKLGFDNGLT